MLGGGVLGAAEFEPHAHVLASSFRVIRLQTLNIEHSERQEPLPVPYSVKVESAAMTRALDSLGLTMPVDVIGHSFGALVALDFALDHPGRVRTLTLAEPPAFWIIPAGERRASADVRTMMDLTRTLVPAGTPTDDQLVRFQCALGNCGVTPPASPDPAWIARRSALRGLSAVASYTNDVGRLRAFRHPTLIVTGSDTVAFHRRINDLLAQNLPLSERASLPGGHGAVVASATEFINDLRAFLQQHPY